ncbi:OLC1v1035014C1 [Oldenlandia corymbosa var. corymbosa]|nr:OLC1v1035014C1 [Oldenlandia corymbosa var. corymbosa]
MMEGMIICAAPHCLKSFLKKSDFETHIQETHGDLLRSGAGKEGNDSEVASTRKPAGSDSTVQAPPRPPFPSHPSSQSLDAHRPPFRDQLAPRPVMPPKGMPPFPGPLHNHSSEQFIDNNAPPGFDRLGPQNRFAPQGIDSPGSMRQESQLPDKQRGIRAESPFREYPYQPPPLQPPGPNYALPVMMNPALAAPQFGYPPFLPDGAQPVFGAPYEMIRPESAPEQGSEPGFPPGPPPMGVNFADGYPRPWNMGPGVGSFEQTSSGQGAMESFINSPSDSQVRPPGFQGDYGRSPGPLPSNLPLPPSGNKGLESGTSMDPRDNKGILAAPPPSLPLPPPPPLPFPPHLAQINRGQFYPDEANNDG